MTHIPQHRWWLALAFVVLFGALLGFSRWYFSPKHTTPKNLFTLRKVRCPMGYTFSQQKAEKIQQLLSRASSAIPIIEKFRSLPLAYCFRKKQKAVIDTNGVMYLDPSTPIEETAARVAHLAMHQIEKIRFVHNQNCTIQVTNALHKETKAMALELRLWKFFGVKRWKNKYPFVKDFWSTKDKDKHNTLLRWLKKYPHGTQGIAPLKHDYTRRCQNTRK